VPGDNNHNVGPTAVRDGALNVFLLAHAFLPAENQSNSKVVCVVYVCAVFFTHFRDIV